MTNKPSTTSHYVDNKKLYQSLAGWLEAVEASNRDKQPRPVLPDYVAECMYKMATRLAQKGGFVNYTFKEEMVGDAMESCLRYIHNFNHRKYTNAFAYITQIIHNAFIRRIQKEQKQLYVKMKIVENADFIDSYERQNHDSSQYNNSYVTYLQENMGDVITKFEDWKEGKKRRSVQQRKKVASVSVLFEDEEEPLVVPEGVEDTTEENDDSTDGESLACL